MVGWQCDKAAAKQVFYGPVQALDDALTVGGEWGAALVLNAIASAELMENSLKLGTIVCTDGTGSPKNTEDVLLECARHGRAGLVRDDCQHAEFAEATNGGKEVRLWGACGS